MYYMFCLFRRTEYFAFYKLYLYDKIFNFDDINGFSFKKSPRI